MLKMLILGGALVTGPLTAAHAAISAAPMPHDSAIIQVGEGCGANHWRDHNGRCHWFGGPGGSNRGTAIECPPGTHIGEGRRACWPNG